MRVVEEGMVARARFVVGYGFDDWIPVSTVFKKVSGVMMVLSLLFSVRSI